MDRLCLASPTVVWRPPQYFSKNQLSPKYREILLDPGSFTKRLLKLSATLDLGFHINVLREGLCLTRSFDLEQQIFGCRYVYIREVQLCLEDHVLMYATSAVPSVGHEYFKRQFRNLKQRPLGGILFKKAAYLQRSSFQVAKLGPKLREYVLTCEGSAFNPSFVWGRRCQFSGAAPMLSLAEYYSPYLFSLLLEG